MALYSETFNHELLATFDLGGVVTCRKIDLVRVWDDATTPKTLVSQSHTPAVLVTQEEAAALIGSAFKAPPEPEPDPEAE